MSSFGFGNGPRGHGCPRNYLVLQRWHLLTFCRFRRISGVSSVGGLFAAATRAVLIGFDSDLKLIGTGAGIFGLPVSRC